MAAIEFIIVAQAAEGDHLCSIFFILLIVFLVFVVAVLIGGIDLEEANLSELVIDEGDVSPVRFSYLLAAFKEIYFFTLVAH